MKTTKFRTLTLSLVIMLVLVSIMPAIAAPGDITLVSKHSSSGTQGNQDSRGWSISVDGRYVAFFSKADNLDSRCDNGLSHIFVHDRLEETTKCVSISTDEGMMGNGDSWLPSISGDGRHVAFYSSASNLVTDDTNNDNDVFVHDRLSGRTVRASVSGVNTQVLGDSQQPTISTCGRYVAFMSWSDDLVPDDNNKKSDIFIRDLIDEVTICVTCVNYSEYSNGDSSYPSISTDGRYVAFQSDATNLVQGGTNGNRHIYRHDTRNGVNTLASISSAGEEGNAGSATTAISADGQFVAFHSEADNLVDNDRNATFDVFVRDLVNEETTRVSISSVGIEGNDLSSFPTISADGRFVAFSSSATNLDPDDNNSFQDVFMHDRETGLTKLISIALNGKAGNGTSSNPKLSADGCFVAFNSDATNLVTNDENNREDVFVWENDFISSMIFLPLIVR